jgi:hypothetical protein
MKRNQKDKSKHNRKEEEGKKNKHQIQHTNSTVERAAMITCQIAKSGTPGLGSVL